MTLQTKPGNANTTEPPVFKLVDDLNLAKPFTHKTQDKVIPEGFVNSTAEKYDWTIGGRDVQMSGGFMESTGHGPKSNDTLFIDTQNQDPTAPNVRKATVPIHGYKKNSGYNIGIDYVVGGDQKVTPWYSGKVTMAKNNGDDYGNSVIVKTDYSYKKDGTSYPIYTRYSHLDRIDVAQNQRVTPSTPVGKMGGSGSKGRNTHPKHVDFKSYIMVNGKEVIISPNLMQSNLVLQAATGKLHSSQSTSSKTVASDIPNTKDSQQLDVSRITNDDAVSMTSSTVNPAKYQDSANSNADVSKVVALLKNNAAEVKRQSGLDVNTDEGLGKAVMQYWKENNLDPKTLKEQLPAIKDSEFDTASKSLAKTNTKESTNTKQLATQQR